MSDKTAEKAWAEFSAADTTVFNLDRRSFMAGRASRDAEIAELRQALYDCYVASGADTDGDNAETMATAWRPYPRLVVEEVRRLRDEADAEDEASELFPGTRDALNRLTIRGH